METYTGKIVEFQRNVGFIEVSKKKKYFFLFDKTEQRKMRREGEIDKIPKLDIGDIVEFKLKQSPRFPDKILAYNVKFVKNERKQQLIEEALVKDTLEGHIRKAEGKLYVEHVGTGLLIPLEVSRWEEDIDSFYKVDSLVKFHLPQTDRPELLTAVVEGREFCDRYHKLTALKTAGTVLNGKVGGKNRHGVFVKILNGKIEAFVLKNEWESKRPEKLEDVKRGIRLDVKVKTLCQNKMILLLIADEAGMFTNNLQTETCNIEAEELESAIQDEAIFM